MIQGCTYGTFGFNGIKVKCAKCVSHNRISESPAAYQDKADDSLGYY